MAQALFELEGTWEEILARSSELVGRKVHVTVLPASENGAKLAKKEETPETPPLSEANKRMLAAMEEWRNTPLSEEEQAILDGFEAFNAANRFTLRQIGENGQTV